MINDVTDTDIQELARLVLDRLMAQAQGVGDGDVDVVSTLTNINSLLAYQKTGTQVKIVEAPLSLLQVGVQRSATHLQWRLGTGSWQDVIALSDLMGKDFKFSDFTPEQLALLTLTFDKLTPAEKEGLKLKFADLTPADIAVLQKPATDAATEVRAEMAQISEEAGQAIEATNTAKGNAETATTAANQAASAANTAASLANTAVEETETATGLALSAATLAEKKADLANTAAQGATTAKENAETATTEATEAALAADTATELATTATTDATAAKDAAVLAARNAQEAADNVQDGKTPQLGIGTVESGSEASATVAAAGSDESGNPKYTLSFVLPQGEEGKAPVIEVGTITTGEPGTGASAELVLNGQTTEGNPKYLFNLSVPRGNQGLPGTGSGNVLVDGTGLVSGKQYMFVPSEDGRSEGTFIEYVNPLGNLAVGDLLYKTIYHSPNGVLVKTSIAVDTSDQMVFGSIEGTFHTPVNAIPLDTTFEFRANNTTVDNGTMVNNSFNLEYINIFLLSGLVHIWVPTPTSYSTTSIFIRSNRGGSYNRVDTLTHVAMPAEGFTNLVKITPTLRKTSELNNDAGFITKTVSDLTNYYPKNQTYTKSDTYTKSETDSAINTKLAGVYKVKGSVANYAALPTTNVAVGDVYNVLDTGANYVATATTPMWDKLSETIDLSAYSTTAQSDAKYFKLNEQNISTESIDIANHALKNFSSFDDSNVAFKPVPASSHATGLRWLNVAGNDTMCGIGTHSINGELISMYVGWGNTPWNNITNFSVSPSSILYKNNVVWHAGNDGSGSGLDADTLDGIQGGNFFYKGLYNDTAGLLVVTTISISANAMCYGRIIGNSYSDTDPFDTTFQFYNYGDSTGDKFYFSKAKNNGSSIGNISIFHLNNRVCIWLPHNRAYQTISMYLSTAASSINQIEIIVDQGMPSSGVTNLVTITPATGANITSNVASATKLETPRSLWGNPFDGTSDKNGTLIIDAAGVTSSVGPLNSSYFHLSTEATLGFHFNKKLNVAGNIIPYTASGNFTLGDSGARWVEAHLNGNLYTYGNSGWHNSTHSGGFHMEDSAWIRTTGNKKILATSNSFDSVSTYGGFHTMTKRNHGWGQGFGALTVLSDINTSQTPVIVMASDPSGIAGNTPATRSFSMEVLNNGQIVKFMSKADQNNQVVFDLVNGTIQCKAVNANTASTNKLYTARTINGVAFDGTANITVTAAANGGTSAACSGNAATATKLQTARTIQGVAFDGTANITLPNATVSANGLMTSSDKSRLDQLAGYNVATNLTINSLGPNCQYINLGNNASLGMTATDASFNGTSITVYITASAQRVITIPTTGSFVSMCGSSYTLPAGKWVEFNLTCIEGKWHIAKLEQE